MGKSGTRNNLVAVAIDKDKASQHAIKWTVENLLSRDQIVILIHVIQRSTAAPSCAAVNKPAIDKATKDIFLTFHCFCTRKDIQCFDVVLEDTDIAKAITEYVSHAAIENLVLGASRHDSIKRLKMVDVPTSVSKAAPDFCTVYVISKSKISLVRNASSLAPFTSPLMNQLQQMQDQQPTADILPPEARPKHTPSMMTGATKTSEMSSFTDFSSTSLENDEVECEMKKLKLELRKTMDLYSTACKEALSEKQMSKELHRLRLEEERKLEEALLAEEAAKKAAEQEKAKYRTASEQAKAAQRVAKNECQTRITAEKKTQQDSDENDKTPTVDALRYKSVSSENSLVGSSSVTKELKHGSITSTDDPLVKKTKECIGRFFYENGLDINAVSSPSFQTMISLCSGQNKFEIPTCDELKGWIFEDVAKEMHEYVDEVRKSWAITGCSILLDGWTDAKGRNLVNILVDCPKATVYLRSFDISDCVGNMEAMQSFLDTVVTEVGVENVVQIITYSTSAFMKEAGEQFTEKYKTIFWTVSASCCIELMLEKLKEIDIIKETLEKAKTITRFIYSNLDALKSLKDRTKGRDLIQPSKIKSTQPFLTLENIVLEEKILKKMFLSPELTSSTKGKNVADIVADESFWSGALTVSKATIPVVKVLEWVFDNNSKEQTGFIYETIDQAKVTIRKEFNRRSSQYIKFWDAIADVWNGILNSPMHIAGYYFNPRFFYTKKMNIDPEIVLGLLQYVARTTRDLHVQDLITTRQLDMFHKAKGAFAPGWPDRRFDVSPAAWWSKYGGDCPELQRLAVRTLSQTCDGASKFQLKRDLAENLLSKGMNENEQKRLAEMVFVQYNMQLHSFGSGKTDHIAPSDIEALDDWMDFDGQDLGTPNFDGSSQHSCAL